MNNVGQEKMSEDTIFGKIIRREIPAKIVHETEDILAFEDINPQAPVHILIIPKRKITGISGSKDSDVAILGEMLVTARKIAEEKGLARNGYRLVINDGASASQTVFHLHLHLLGGRAFSWPPG